MTRNMGRTDRLLRAFVVAPLLAIGAVFADATTAGGIALLAGAAIMLVTAASGFCPLYRIFGVDTRGRRVRAH